jgi:hypothetical protein
MSEIFNVTSSSRASSSAISINMSDSKAPSRARTLAGCLFVGTQENSGNLFHVKTKQRRLPVRISHHFLDLTQFLSLFSVPFLPFNRPPSVSIRGKIWISKHFGKEITTDKSWRARVERCHGNMNKLSALWLMQICET